MIDEARAALVRYLMHCLRAERRAQMLLQHRQQRTAAAKQQIRDYDHESIQPMQERAMAARARGRGEHDALRGAGLE